jgi:hypothetical protein
MSGEEGRDGARKVFSKKIDRQHGTGLFFCFIFPPFHTDMNLDEIHYLMRQFGQMQIHSGSRVCKSLAFVQDYSYVDYGVHTTDIPAKIHGTPGLNRGKSR